MCACALCVGWCVRCAVACLHIAKTLRLLCLFCGLFVLCFVFVFVVVLCLL